jgi:hypothetical protein
MLARGHCNDAHFAAEVRAFAPVADQRGQLRTLEHLAYLIASGATTRSHRAFYTFREIFAGRSQFVGWISGRGLSTIGSDPDNCDVFRIPLVVAGTLT